MLLFKIQTPGTNCTLQLQTKRFTRCVELQNIVLVFDRSDEERNDGTTYDAAPLHRVCPILLTDAAS